jgi:hypothetical protein
VLSIARSKKDAQQPIAFGREQEIDGLSFTVNGSVQYFH